MIQVADKETIELVLSFRPENPATIVEKKPRNELRDIQEGDDIRRMIIGTMGMLSDYRRECFSLAVRAVHRRHYQGLTLRKEMEQEMRELIGKWR